MIKFFRKIRFDLMENNKTGKYIKYAAGEIVLVVVGILIALQINNWNEQRKEDLQEQATLKRLEKEFKSNKDQLVGKINIRNGVIKNCERLLEYYNEPKNATLDSIFLYMGSIVPTTFDPIHNDLVSSGTIDLLKNEELKQLLINWSTDVIQLQEVEQMFLRYGEQNLLPYVAEKGIGRDISFIYWNQAPVSLLESKKVRNLIPGKSKLSTFTKDELLSDSKLESIIAHTLDLNLFNNQESETLMNRINYILQVVDSEILY
jgi:hypothetical protein